MSSPVSGNTLVDSLLTLAPRITGLDDFLDYQDDREALFYWLSEFVPRSRLTVTDDIFLSLQQAIAELDELINAQLNQIIHHPDFQRLEASWRGLWMLVEEVAGAKQVKIRLLDITWQEVGRDIARALEFDQSQLFQKIYNYEYGTPGGEPYGVLIGDFEISHRPATANANSDITTLEGMAQIATAAFAPFICGCSPTLFGVDDFSTLGHPLNLNSIFAQQEYISWRSLRDKPETRFVGLTLPRILMRLPYQTQGRSYKGICFREETTCDGYDNYCWGNAAYGFATILLREFINVGWFGHIRGVPRNQFGGGLLTRLPGDRFASDPRHVVNKPATDVIITDIRERELSELGFIPLCHGYDSPFAAFYSNQSLFKPPVQTSQEASVNARLSAMIQHVLCGSRIAHYIKVMIRDKIGSFITADECEDYLRNWLHKYTTGQDGLDWEEQARYPLREAAVTVKDHPGKPGDFVCVIHLKPHYQLDHMVSELELVTELAQPV